MSEPVAAGASCALHLQEEASFTCARCGTYGCPACIFGGLPGKEICRACAAAGLPEPLPWERRKSLGWWLAFRQTTRLVLREPTATFRTPSTEDGLVGPILFGAIAYVLGQLVIALVFLLLLFVAGAALAVAADQPEVGGVLAGYGLCMVPLALLQAPVYAIFGMLFSGGLGHLTLVALKKARAPFDQTLRAVCYANAPHVLEILSCIAIFWVIAAETIALRELHRCSTGTALVATLGWRLFFLVLLLGGYAALVALLVAAEAT